MSVHRSLCNEQLLYPSLDDVRHHHVATSCIPALLAANLQVLEKVEAAWFHCGPQRIERGLDLRIVVAAIIDNNIEIATTLCYPLREYCAVTLIPHECIDALQLTIRPSMLNARPIIIWRPLFPQTVLRLRLRGVLPISRELQKVPGPTK